MATYSGRWNSGSLSLTAMPPPEVYFYILVELCTSRQIQSNQSGSLEALAWDKTGEVEDAAELISALVMLSESTSICALVSPTAEGLGTVPPTAQVCE